MYGKFCAVYREYGNGNTELGAMVDCLGGDTYPFCVYNDGEKTEKDCKRLVGRGGE